MSRESNEVASTRPATAAELRKVAARARRLAGQILDQQAEATLIAFAEEMEARAAALEPAAQHVSHSGAVAVQQSDPDASQG
jgi:hypothetical protein